MSFPAVEDPAGATAPVHFTGRDWVFRRLVTRGALLELITFGFYRFWLITDIRRHLWSHTEIAGDAMEYIGRAKELLFGFLVATAVLGPIFLVYFVLGLEMERFKEFGSLPLYLFLFAFGQFAVYRARRYRLTRTVWRGVRFWMTGSGWSYAGRSIAWGLLLLPTLGFAYPWRLAALERYKLRHTHYGSLPGRFEGTGRRLFQRVWWVWLLGLLPFLIIAAGQLALVAATHDAKQPQPALAVAAVGILLVGVLMLIPLPFLHAVRRAREWAWWAGGIRFGSVEVGCALPSGSLIGIYWKLIALVALVVFGWMAIIGGLTAGLLMLAGGGRDAAEALMRGPYAAWAIAGYAASYLLMLVTVGALWRIYTLQRVWRRVVEACTVLNIGAAAEVAVAGDTVSGFGEGLADNLDFGV